MKKLHILSAILLTVAFSAAQAKSPYEAARTGDLEALRLYRFEGSDLYIPDRRGFIPYELAALHADPEKIDVLQRHVEIMLWLKEYNPQKHIYGKAANALVQASLNALGYQAGKPDGILGKKSGEAIRAYQRDNELAETGRLGPQWLGMLYQDSLKDLQFKLTKLGYETYGTDGKMGPNTRNAMLKYRQDNALSVPDYPHLDDLLVSSVEQAFNQKEQQRKDATAEKARQESLLQTRYAQTGLHALGYRIGKVDGMLGSKTANAIKAFQGKYKLPVSGELDSQTLAEMDKVFTQAVQRQLNALGYAVGKPDGQVGKLTRGAIKSYRKHQGLAAGGGIDADLMSHLQKRHTALEDRRNARSAALSNEKNASRVKFAQAGLRTLGHPISVDGVMGKTTAQYLKKFQKRYRLKVTRKIDEATYAKMQLIFLKETQRKLNALGYPVGKPDGRLGKRSRVAIKKFRQKQGLSSGGMTATLIAAVDDAYDNRSKTQKTKVKRRQSTVEIEDELPLAKTIPQSGSSTSARQAVAKVSAGKSLSGGRSAKGRMAFKRSGGRVVGCTIAGRNIPIEWCEPFYPLTTNNHCEATFKPSNGTVINLWCK